MTLRRLGLAAPIVRASTTRPAVRLAFEFLVLKAARRGEVRRAVLGVADEGDPPSTGCHRAAEILDAARALGGGSTLVFTRGGGTPHEAQGRS